MCLLAGAALSIATGCGGTDRASPSGCDSDVECKGDRICNEDGQCVDPGAGSTSGSPAGSGAGSGSGSGGSAGTVHPCGPPGSGPPSGNGSGSDTTPPSVSCIGFDKMSYAAGEVGHLEYLATDSVSGITDFEGNCWGIDSASGASQFYACSTVEHLGGDLYRVEFDVGEFVEDGEFFLSSASIHDKAGNGFDLYAEYADPTYEGTQIAVARTTVAASATDTTPPEVSSIAFDSSVYAPGTTGWIEYQATDELSGITDFEGNCWSIDSASGNTSLSACGTVESLGSRIYRLPFEIDPYVEKGQYFLRSATLHDKAENGLQLSASYEDSLYEGTTLAVARATIE